MCFNILYLERKAQREIDFLKDIVINPLNGIADDAMPVSNYFLSGFTHPLLPIVKHDGIFLFEWGLIPFWIKNEKEAKAIQKNTLNAIGETVFEKPSFRKAIATQRCLLPVGGFYEWRDYNKVKYPYLVKLRDKEIFSLGCLYDTWVDKETGEMRNTFSIITTPANPLMSTIHNLKKRMPLIIASQDEKKWIDPALSREEIEALIKPFPEAEMTAYTISRNANNARYDRNTPEILEPVIYPELEQADLQSY